MKHGKRFFERIKNLILKGAGKPAPFEKEKDEEEEKKKNAD